MFITIDQKINELIGKNYYNTRKVIMIHPITLNIIKIFDSAIKAGLAMKIDIKTIRNTCIGLFNQAGGYYWKYLDEYIKELNGEYYIKCYPQSNNLFNNKFKCDIFDFIVYKNMSNYINPCYKYKFVEIWKDIVGYEGLYKVSNWGRILSIRNYPYVFEMNMRFDKNYYYYIILCDKNGNQKTYKIHRLVAQAFIPNPFNLPCVNHKNEIKTDNRSINLEWCTVEYNSNYGTAIERSAINRGKIVLQIDLNTDKIINEFWSINEASRITGICQCHISEVCNKIRNKAGGYGWKFKENIFHNKIL